VDFDDGYTGGGQSYEIVEVPDRPRLLMGPASQTLTFYRFYMKPNVIVAPSRIPLSTANGSRVSLWCNLRTGAVKTYRAVSQELYLAFFGSEAEIRDAFIAERVEIIMQIDQRECGGEFEIYDDDGDDDYDDAVGWTVTANGTVGLQGESSVSEQANAVGGSTYGVASGAVLLASGHFTPPPDDILRLRLQCWAQNVGDGKKETCVQIVVVPRE
jgi:predicted secreted protein